VLAGQKPPMAAGEIVQVWAHPRHSESSGLDASGAPMPRQVMDQVLVFAHVKLRNQSHQPLYLHQILTNARLDDGIHSSYAATAAQYEEIFIAYPELAALHAKPLATTATLAPGQSLEGDIVSAFRLTKPQWDARKKLDFTFAFEYQPSLVLAPHTAVSER
jgi:hypothetical protein